MKRFYFIALFAFIGIMGAQAQKVEFRQSQSRMLEPVQEVFVRPLVVDLKVLTDTRQETTWPFPDVKVTDMTVTDLEMFKANALYLTAQKFDADVIVAASFDVRTAKKGIEITVIGFPARYENWKVATQEADYKWIKEVYDLRTIKSYENNAVNALKGLPENSAK